MKKLVLIIAVFAIFSMSANAQDVFGKGTQLFKIGIGFNSLAIPIEVSYEKGVKDGIFGVEKLNLGLGVYGGYFGYSEDFAFSDGSKYSW